MELLLEKNELLDLGEKQQERVLICQAGHCWLTEQGNLHDQLLSDGTRYRIRSRGRIIITATSACRLQILPSTPQADQSPWWRLSYHN